MGGVDPDEYEVTPLIDAISVSDRSNDNQGFWLGLDWYGQELMTEACKLATDTGLTPWASPSCGHTRLWRTWRPVGCPIGRG